jgi:photosystem II stability/assembly factor-like uncharacterized protein
LSVNNIRRFWLLTAMALTAGAASSPAGVAPALMQNLQWRMIGPFRGGRVLAVAGAPDDRERFYFGSVDGGVWRSDDAGRTWEATFDKAGVGSIGAIAVAPSAPNILYVGTGEADMRSDIAQGRGMFRSGDGGRSWSAIGLDDSQQIGKILVDPRDPNTVLVAALGHPYGANPMRGVFRSSDGGKTWARVLFHDENTGAIDLAYQPGDPDVVYASLWQTRRPPWNVYPPSSGPGSGLYKSTDGGKTWTQVQGHGFPAAPGRIGIGLSAARPHRVYALVSASDAKPGEAGLYRSEDDGVDWTRVGTDPRIIERGWYFSGVTIDPANADSVYVCNTILLHSSDGGRRFIPVKGDPTGDDFHVLWIDPKDSTRQMLGVDQGAVVTVDNGRSWSSWYNQPTGQFYHVSTDNRFPYNVYGAQQDTGAAGVASRNINYFDGISMMQFHETAAGGESDNIAPDPDDPDEVYGGRVDKLDLHSGQMRSVDPTLAFPDGYRGTWTLPLVWGKLDHALYFANQRIFRTADGGLHWQPISPDLTMPDPGVPASLDAPTAADVPTGKPGAGTRRGVVYALAPSPITHGLIWAGTDDGLVWRSSDDGAHWVNVTPKGLAAWSKIGVIEASRFDPLVAYIAVDRHRLGDTAPYIYRTGDGGKSWTAIVQGLPNDDALDFVNVVREDTVQRGLLYAGTESGAFVSFDDGAHWQDLQRGLPPTSVRDMVLHGDDLVLATHGRGFYILDDMSELRTLAKDGSAGPRLFTPADAIRLNPPAFTGTPLPKDEPMAPNPPDGMIIDYALPSGVKKLTISIEDAQGKTVRRFSSTDHPAPPDLATIQSTAQWVQPPPPPSAAAGAQRFVWDLHGPVPKALADDPQAQGIWAAPGAYTVALDVDGKTMQAGSHILPDPRLALAPGALDQQFALAEKIEAAQVDCARTLADAAALQKTLVAAVGHAAIARKTEIWAVLGDLDVLIGAKNGTGPAPDSLGGLAPRLAALAQAVEGADAAPSADALSGFAQAQTALAGDLKSWEQIAASVRVKPAADAAKAPKK